MKPNKDGVWRRNYKAGRQQSVSAAKTLQQCQAGRVSVLPTHCNSVTVRSAAHKQISSAFVMSKILTLTWTTAGQDMKREEIYMTYSQRFVFWYVTPCSLVASDLRFWGACRIHIRCLLLHSFTLKMEAADSSETLCTGNHAVRFHCLGDNNLHSNRHKNHKLKVQGVSEVH